MDGVRGDDVDEDGDKEEDGGKDSDVPLCLRVHLIVCFERAFRVVSEVVGQILHRSKTGDK